MSELELEPEQSVEDGVTASMMLCAAREDFGLSQKEVADQLYLTTTFIKHIDEGAFDKFPKPAFIKGYLRSYARTVELSGDEVVACYEKELHAAEENVRIRDVTEETVGSVAITGPVFETGLVGLFGVVVVVAMVWWIASSGDDADDHIPQVTSAVESEAEPIQDSVVEASRPDFDFVLQGDPIVVTTDIAVQSIENLDAAEPVFNEPEAGDIETSAAVLDSTLDRQVTETQGQLDETSGPIENDIRVERSQDGDVTYITVNANGFDEVEATFLDDCWLEVEDGNGDSIYGDLNKSGEVLRIYGVAPFQLLIGRASALNLTFNGDVVDLARFASTDETAKVTLTRQR